MDKLLFFVLVSAWTLDAGPALAWHHEPPPRPHLRTTPAGADNNACQESKIPGHPCPWRPDHVPYYSWSEILGWFGGH